MEAKLDFNKMGSIQDSNISITYFAFLAIHSELVLGKTVEDIKLCCNGEMMVEEKGFREFITRVCSMDYDQLKLSEKEKDSLEKMVDYLAVPV